ncbi:DUF2764 domain-containing protein [Legionella bononiensis]|nr:DUF2764 domain-containing protein [Legionella bononiensis]
MTTQFYTVVSSLPRMSAYFKIKETPISRLQLEKRLKLLPSTQYELLIKIESLVWTSWFQPQHSLNETKMEWLNLPKIDSALVREVIAWYLDLRSILTALRMRNEKKIPPDGTTDYWITRWSYKLKQNWNQPDFGLQAVYPWLPKIAVEIAKDDILAVEEFLLVHIWNYLSIIETGHYFDFEFLIIYLLRWNIIDY